MNKKLFIINDITYALQQFIFFSSLLIFLMMMDKTTPIHYYYVCFVALYLIASGLIGMFFSSFPIIFTGQLLSCCVILPFCHTLQGTCFNVMVIILQFIFAISMRNNTEHFIYRHMPTETILFYVAFYIFSTLYHNSAVSLFFLTATLVYMVVSLLASFLCQLYHYTSQNANTSNTNMKQIIHTHIYLFILFFLIYFAIAASAIIFPVEAILARFLEVIENIIKWPLRLLLYYLTSGETVYQSTIPSPVNLKHQYIPQIVTIVWDVLQFFIKLFLYILCIKWLLRGLQHFYRWLLVKKSSKSDTITYTKPDIKHHRSHHRLTPKQSNTKETNNAKKVRLAFQKLVYRHTQTAKHIFPSATVQSICDSMQIEEEKKGQTIKDYDDVCHLYEKARYSNTPVSAKDVLQMQKHCR